MVRLDDLGIGLKYQSSMYVSSNLTLPHLNKVTAAIEAVWKRVQSRQSNLRPGAVAENALGAWVGNPARDHN